ncbi:DPBB and LysM peptidoglycan-binding domain-containing protein [Mucilaginibacter aquatilis]|uniref:LysM peptidoglycan-binding domain-containing protein n=1 Tax=Mucilaginibacter aquatilis TaxID=1517760 RepID=A0A6I4IGS3_9SPHI|nr:LysM peptidoglycan-binding domain-containing protein [Mucilaginibacter aquatilis]MVN92746.1 LysM peptidoglycan-binding domain-containing protein [Mucilaginibacter aquatilis]
MTSKLIFLGSIISYFATPVLAHSPLDSIGVENLDGKKVILHKLDPKDNYYSVGRRYNVKPTAVIQFNSNTSLRVGKVIKVPTDLPFVSPGNTPAPSVSTSTPAASGGNQITEYKVSPGETLYAISKRFNVRVEDIMSQNNLTSNALQPGQILKIKAVTQNPATVTPPQPAQQTPVVSNPAIDSAKRDSTTVAANDSISVERRLPANRYGLTERNEKGVATFLDDAGLGLDPNKKLVLHRTAPVGTVLKIINPMTNRTTYAKVVGRFTDNEMTKDVIIVLTKSAADALGSLDKRFHVTISYGMPNEQE